MIVDQEAVRARPARSSIAAERAVEIRRLEHRGSPSRRSSVSMPSRTAGSLSMQSTGDAGELAGVDARLRRAPAASTGAARRQRHVDREARAAADARVAGRSSWSSTRAMRSTIDRPRPRPRATLAPWSSRWNSRKIVALLRLRNAEAGVVDVDAQLAAAAPAADQHAALRRVFDRVGDEVLQQPAQQPPVGAHRRASTARRRGRGPCRAPAARIRPRAGAAIRRCGSWRTPAASRRCRAAKCRAARRRSPRPPRARRRCCRPAARPRRRPAARSGW